MDKKSYYDRISPYLNDRRPSKMGQSLKHFFDDDFSVKEKIESEIKFTVKEKLQLLNKNRDNSPEKKLTDDEIQNLMSDISRNVIQQNIIEEISQHFKNAAFVLKEFDNTKKHEFWADLWSKFTYLTLRILTGIGLAGVILGTGWIAQEYQIPLPLLRLQ